MKSAQLLDQARQVANLPSDYAVAKRLGISSQIVSEWRHARKYPGALATFQLAEMAKRNPAEVIAEIELERAERAGRPGQVESWRAVFQRVATAAAVGGVVLITAAPPSANAAMTRAQVEPTPSVYYVNKRRRRTWLESLFPAPSLQLA